MATRTLKNRKDRLTTMLVIPFMSCGAKLPVYVLLIGAFFAENMRGNVLFAVYIFGAIFCSFICPCPKKTVLSGLSEPFVMELPPYRVPTFKSLWRSTMGGALAYMRKAATVILFFSVLIFFLSNYPQSKAQDKEEKTVKSYAERIGIAFEPVMRPLGFDENITIALVFGFAAQEVVVSTLGIYYNQDGKTLEDSLAVDSSLNRASAISLLIFVLLYVPCIAAVVMFYKESQSAVWTFGLIAGSTILAWIMSYIGYNLAMFAGI